ncbi:MAG TPA: hypothetical protein VIM10_18190 [Actinopolymorphaceae bacterium]|jgi:hypothetical protein
MSEDQFTKLFKYMQEFRQDVGDRFGEVDKRFDDLTNLIDGYAGNLDTYALEMAAMDHKISRLEKYIQVLAAQAGVDLDRIHV